MKRTLPFLLATAAVMLAGCSLIQVHGPGGRRSHAAGGGSDTDDVAVSRPGNSVGAAEASGLPGHLAFPPPPPKTGKTAGCPAQAVLARRFSFQNDRNGGGYGYYVVARGQGGAQIVKPSRRSIDMYVRHKVLVKDRMGRLPSPDVLSERLRFLWGTYCAYHDVDYVERALETARKLYVQKTGMSLAAEAQLHQSMIDTGGQAASSDFCAANHQDATSRVIAGAICRVPRTRAVARAFSAIDTQGPSPIYGAAVIAACREMSNQKYARFPYRYLSYRFCTLHQRGVTPYSVRAALDKLAIPRSIKDRFFGVYARGAATLSRLAPLAAERERAYPTDKKLFDDSIAQVKKSYMPQLTRWKSQLASLRRQHATFSKGPGYARGCDVTLHQSLSRYVNTVVPRGRPELILDALRDPIGYQIGATLAMCYRALGDHARADMLQFQLLAGATLVTNFHDALWDVLAKRRYMPEYRPSRFNMRERFSKPAATHLPEPARLRKRDRSFSGGGRTSYASIVGSVQAKGNKKVIHFKKTSGWSLYEYGCKTNYKRPLRIDRWGNIIYQQYGCKTGRAKVDTTPPSVIVAPRDVVAVRPGTKVRVSIGTRGYSRKAKPGVVMWVKRGRKLIWLAGLRR